MTSVEKQELKKIQAIITKLLEKDTEGGEHMVDADAPAYSPSYLIVHEHQKGGMVDVSKIALYVTPEQEKGLVDGKEIQKALVGQPTLNACILDYLLAHTDIIPQEWKGKYVYFWGTIYRVSDGNLCVRCLCWNDGQWYWSNGCLDYGWDVRYPAAILASA